VVCRGCAATVRDAEAPRKPRRKQQLAAVRYYLQGLIKFVADRWLNSEVQSRAFRRWVGYFTDTTYEKTAEYGRKKSATFRTKGKIRTLGGLLMHRAPESVFSRRSDQSCSWPDPSSPP
jgi:hypothetical protein